MNAVDKDREFPFLVGMEALIGVAALAEAAEDVLARVAGRHDGLAEMPNGSVVRDIERLGCKSWKPLATVAR